ncbi:hypothetical protein FOZ61_007805 [Perkinsus olseni]|uniref:G-patch domain-containing protein n=1 Tax=Perkinsus olseni TaxID=32597 RepID=A0A7J6M847_PEROL|nr:hypothetical protein FOZ61_007805 [Perkinsus olseni]KAF4673523.1 hypothetical protein FOL46_007013 [Perkinsus olseni]
MSSKACCGGRLSKRQCACCICCSLLVVICLILILLIFILAPALAEAALNDSEFSVDEMEILGENVKDCDADADFCLDTIFVSTFHNPMIFGATVEPFIASVSTDEAVIAHTSMPSVKVRASSDTTVNETVVVTVSNRSEFDRFSAEVIAKESVQLRMKANITVKSFGIKFSGLRIDKSMAFVGLNNFEGARPSMVDLNLITSLGDVVRGQARFLATLQVDNPSVVTVRDVGQIFGDIMYGERQIGMFKTAGDISVTGGQNTNIAAEIMFAAGVGMLRLVGDLILTLVGGDDVVVDVRGRNSSNPIFDAAVKSIEVSMLLAAPKGSALEAANGSKKQEDYMDTMSTDQMDKTYGIGFRLLRKNGYSGEGSLGKTNKGVAAPIAVYRRKDKEGLRDDEREQRFKEKLHRRSRRQKKRAAHGPLGDIAAREKLLQGLVRLIRTTGQDQMPLWLAAHKVHTNPEELRRILSLYPKHFQITHYEGEDHVVLRNLSADTIVCECSASFPTRDACILHLTEIVVNPTNPTDATHPQLIGRLSETTSGNVDNLYCLVCDMKCRSAISLAVHSLGARVDESISEHRQFGYSLLCAAASGNEDDFDQFYNALKSHNRSFNWDSFGAACADPGVEIEFSEPDVLFTGEVQSCDGSEDSVSEVPVVDLDGSDTESSDSDCVEIVDDSPLGSRPRRSANGTHGRVKSDGEVLSVNIGPKIPSAHYLSANAVTVVEDIDL